jgi:hypothetical protein
MAVHAVCEFCGHRLSVPDHMKGKKISCPKCNKKTRVITPLELTVEDARNKHAGKTEAEKEEPAPEEPAEKAPAAVQEDAPPPGSPGTRYPALRALGALLTALAYLLALLALAVGVLLYLRTGAEKNLLYIFGGVIAAAVSFIVFKVFAESAKLGADLGDMESRMIQLLFELRDKLDNLK